MTVRKATLKDKNAVLSMLDEFRADCITQITGNNGASNSAKTGGVTMYDSLLKRNDYCVLLLETQNKIIGVITGYLCPMLRSGQVRAEIEEFYINPGFRGKGGAEKLMDAFFTWCKSKDVVKVNLESNNSLRRAYSFYEKYGFTQDSKRLVKKIF